MTAIEIGTLIISLCSLLIAIFSFFWAQSSNSKSHLNAQGMIELEIYSKIDEAENRIADFSITMNPLIAKEKIDSLTAVEKESLKLFRTTLKAKEQTMLNAYDTACTKYRDNKVDRSRFKKDFQTRIRNLMNDKNMSKYLENHASPYQAIIKVFHDWEDTEK